MSSESSTQISPPLVDSPDVTCRLWPWTVSARARAGAITATHVVSKAAGSPDIECFLEPFDLVTRAAGPVRWRAASGASLHDLVARWPTVGWPEAPLVGAIDAPIDVLPHQLVPAMAVATGRATRVLLADPVGMGKTIEAGLVVRELQSRGAASRVLVLTPATLRDQWREELQSRVSIASSVVDRAVFEARRRSVPPGIAVFRPPGCHVMSVDLARQPDVLASLTAVTWDVLIVDEAHLAAGDTARAAAAHEIAARTRVVLLLTATPHSGDPLAFSRLCSLGRLDGEPPIALVRSAPRATNRPAAVRREVAVPQTAGERAARQRLTTCLRLLDEQGSPAARLVAIVLRKRALSSMAALASSLRHRLEWLDRQPGVVDQPRLPFSDGEIEADDVAQPAVLREAPLCGSGERAALARALEAATGAARDSGKLRMLSRLLRRTRDRVIVFTEYRDTLDAIAAALSATASIVSLHGGLDRQARSAALRTFAEGEARVLLATDVAAEGLNLQHACRLVVHFELPWSPSRLAQRDGRVDRFGQSRRVHLWRLVGDRRHEARVLAALASRVARMAAAGLDVAGLPAPPPGDVVWTDCAPVDIDDSEAVQAAEAVMLVRRLLELRRNGKGRPRAGVPWRRLRHKSAELPRGVIVGLLVQGSGVGSRPTVRFVHVALRRWPDGHPARWLPAIVVAAAGRLPAADTSLSAALRARESRLASRARLEHRRQCRRWQASLFEQRAAAVVAARRHTSAATLDEHRRRLAELDLAPAAATPVIALLVR